MVNQSHTQVDEAAHDVQTSLGPLPGHVSGFVAYDVLDARNNTVVAISIFESKKLSLYRNQSIFSCALQMELTGSSNRLF